jgi:NADH-quinone oxidoreductase subunit N
MFVFPIPDIQVTYLLPLLIVAVTGVLALLVEMFSPKSDNSRVVIVSILGLLAAGAVLLTQVGDFDDQTGARMIAHDSISSILQLIIILSTGLTVLFSDRYLREKRVPFGEFYPLVLWSTCGAMLMVSTTNLMMIFIGLEILSISLYVMACMSREEWKSEESAMKYFLLGAFASGFLLYGIALIYGGTGGLDMGLIASAYHNGPGFAKVLITAGTGLMLIGLCFKAGFVPFHQWTPDVYQGAPTNVTAFMATASKIGAFGALWRILDGTNCIANLWGPALTLVAILTMIVGNVMALAQKDVKRVLGYSSISHAGYILVAIISHGAAPAIIGISTLAFYLLSYSLMTIGAFAIVSMFARGGQEGTTFDDLRGLWSRSPAATVLLVIFVLSLIGIPPLSGFFGKAFIFMDALKAGQAPLAIVLAGSSVISVAYYLRIALAAVTPAEGSEPVISPFKGGIVATSTLCAVGVIATTIFYWPLINLLHLESDPGRSVPQRTHSTSQS